MRTLVILLLVCGICVAMTLPNETLNAPTTAVALGERLFNDKVLSSDKKISCASCHRAEFAFADTSRFSQGVEGKKTLRNTPSVMNMANRSSFFFDGRAQTLEEQVFHPIRNPLEMNLDARRAVKRLRRHKGYNLWFKKIYGHAPDSISLGDALASFVRSLESQGDAAADLWINDEDSTGLMTEEAMRGRELFLGKAKCFDCHFSPDFTGDEFKNVGLFDGKLNNDVGRFAVTRDSTDLGKMKVPGLRNVAITPPYMHDGRFNTLEEVVEYYENPKQFVADAINVDVLLQRPLQLTAQEKSELVAFLHSLTDARFR